MAERTRDLFEARRSDIFRQTDHLFAVLLLLEWLAAIMVAVLISPLTWAGGQSWVHIHVWAAFFLGGAIVSFPVFATIQRPGDGAHPPRRRGRADAHGRPADPPHRRPDRDAFPRLRLAGLPRLLPRLAGARDRPRSWSCSTISSAGSSGRGRSSASLTVSPWRWLEHAGWVVFEDIFLIRCCRASDRRDARPSPSDRPSSRRTRDQIERTVELRTAELATANAVLMREVAERQQAEAELQQGQGGRRGGQPGQERVPGQHEPRDPHADERHHRHDRAGPGHRADAAAARVPRPGQELGRRAAGGHQRHPRLLQDRGRQAGARPGAVRACATRWARRSRRWRCGRTPRGWSWPAGSRRTCPTRWSATPAGCARSLVNLVGNAIKFTEQRRGRRDRRRRGACDDGDGVVLRFAVADTGIGIPAEKLRGDLRAVRAGRRLDDAAVRRHGAGPGDLGQAGGADGRPDLGRERAGPRQHLPVHGRAGRPAAATPVAAAAPSRTSPAGGPAGPGRRRQRHQPADPRGGPRRAGAPGRRPSRAAPAALEALRAAAARGPSLRRRAGRRHDARDGRPRAGRADPRRAGDRRRPRAAPDLRRRARGRRRSAGPCGSPPA